jgi:hypothetical protein
MRAVFQQPSAERSDAAGKKEKVGFIKHPGVEPGQAAISLGRCNRMVRPTDADVPASPRSSALDSPDLDTSAQLTLDLEALPALPSRPFRVERTLLQESVFVSSSFKGDSFAREVMTLDPLTGEPVLSRVIVGKKNDDDKGRGLLRQRHQDAMYRLLLVWHRAGYPVARTPKQDGQVRELGVINMTVYELVSILCPGDDSASAYKRADNLLDEMRGVPIRIENVSTWQGWVNAHLFYLLGDYSWDQRKIDRKTRRVLPGGSSSVTIWFSEFLTSAFRAGYVHPLLSQPYEQLAAGRGRPCETARLLYPYIDEKLAWAPRFEAPLKELAERFLLAPHQQPSRRKMQFTPARRALDGQLILEGKYTLATSFTEVDNDFALVCKRVLAR